MKLWDKFVEKCIERKPVKVILSKSELLRLIEEAERAQLEKILEEAEP